MGRTVKLNLSLCCLILKRLEYAWQHVIKFWKKKNMERNLLNGEGPAFFFFLNDLNSRLCVLCFLVTIWTNIWLMDSLKLNEGQCIWLFSVWRCDGLDPSRTTPLPDLWWVMRDSGQRKWKGKVSALHESLRYKLSKILYTVYFSVGTLTVVVDLSDEWTLYSILNCCAKYLLTDSQAGFPK